MATLDEENAALEARIAELKSKLIPSSSDLNWRGVAETATGGLLNLGKGLVPFGAFPKGVAGANALIDALQGQPLSEAYANRLAQVKELENKYKEAVAPISVAGITPTEIGGALLMPLPKIAAAGTEALPAVKAAAPIVTKLAEKLAPITKSAALGAGLGGGQAYVESEKPLLSEERLQAAIDAAKVGGLLGGGIGAIGEGIKTIPSIASKLIEYGKGLERSSIGLRASDYSKKRGNRLVDVAASENPTIETLPNDYQTQVGVSANNVIENNTLGSTRNPTKLHSNLVEKKNDLEQQIQSTLENAQKDVGQVPLPDTSRTQQYIIDNVDPADEGKYLDKLLQKLDMLKQKGEGKLTFLNEQKRKLANEWKKDPSLDSNFWRSLYLDYKDHIEKYAPQVKQLNKQKQDLLVLEPILERNKRLAEAPGITPQKLTKALFYTTGGLGIPTAIAGGPLTTTLALGLAGLGTKTGQKITGRLAQKVGGAGAGITGTGVESLTSALQKVIPSLTATEPTQQSFPTEVKVSPETNLDVENAALEAKIADLKKRFEGSSSTETPQHTVEIKGQKIALPVGEGYAPPELVKAVMQTESAKNPKAVSSKGALGLMQLMPGTAKELGVDPTIPEQNIEGGSRYLGQQLKKFNDLKLALAAYNWGPARIKSAIKNLQADNRPVTWDNIKTYVKAPAETRNYVDRVMGLI